MIFRLVVTSLVLVAVLTGCCRVPADGPRKIATGVPFYFNQTGRQYQLRILVERNIDYDVKLYMHVTAPHRYFYFLDDDSLADTEKLRAMTGVTFDPTTNERHDSGLPSSFRIRITTDTGNCQLVDALVTHPSTFSVHAGRYAVLSTVRLPPGAYKIQVTALDISPVLAPLTGGLAVTVNKVPK